MCISRRLGVAAVSFLREHKKRDKSLRPLRFRRSLVRRGAGSWKLCVSWVTQPSVFEAQKRGGKDLMAYNI